MNKDDTIVIERTANGYMVHAFCGRNDPVSCGSFYVFQDMGYASAARDHQNTADTLLGFIAAHFSEGKSEGK